MKCVKYRTDIKKKRIYRQKIYGGRDDEPMSQREQRWKKNEFFFFFFLKRLNISLILTDLKKRERI